MPSIKVSTAVAPALAALSDRNELVIVELEEGNNALTFAICSFNESAGTAHCRPRSAESACPFGEEGVVSDASVHDGLDAVVHFVEVAGG